MKVTVTEVNKEKGAMTKVKKGTTVKIYKEKDKIAEKVLSIGEE